MRLPSPGFTGGRSPGPGHADGSGTGVRSLFSSQWGNKPTQGSGRGPMGMPCRTRPCPLENSWARAPDSPAAV